MKRKIILLMLVCVCAVVAAHPARAAQQPSGQLEEADKLLGLQKFDQAEQTYLDIVQQSGADAFPAVRQLAILYITTGEQAKADATVESLLTGFSSQPTLPRDISLVADACIKAANYQKAKGLCEHIVKQWPDTNHLLWAKAGYAKIDIAKENDTDAETRIDAFITDFNDHPDLSQAVLSVAETYFDKAFAKCSESLIELQHKYLRKALHRWEQVLTDLPGSEALKADACFLSADCYRVMDERLDAIERYEQLVKRWPGHDSAPSAQYLVGQGYRQLWLLEPKANHDALEKARTAYRKLVADYPNTRPAAIAARWLKVNDK